MDRSEYIRLLCEASVNDTTKFAQVSSARPPKRDRPPKRFHPLLEREKHLQSVVSRILPAKVACVVNPRGSRLAHLYGLPKTHKAKLSMRPILSASGTYNYNSAKWLDEKLKPLSCNTNTITDMFAFANELKDLRVNKDDILVSYDVTSLFTNVPLLETIDILVEKAFIDDWFNKTHNLDISKQDLEELLKEATMDQLFQFNSHLYKQRMVLPWVHP